MNTKEFDKLITEKLAKHEFAYNSSNWEKLAGELDAPKSSFHGRVIWLRVTAIAASLALLVSAVAWFYTGKPEHIEIAQRTSPNSNNNNQQSNTVIPATEQIDIAEENKEAENNNLSAPPVPPIAKQTKAVMPQPMKEEAVLQAAKNNSDQPSLAKTETETTAPEKQAPANTNSPSVPKYNSGATASNSLDFAPPRPTAKTSFSFTGGMNYGTMNEGYTAGINAKQKIGRKLFVEGDLALVNNKASQATLTPEQYDAYVGGALKGKPEEVKTAANFMYLQFNPGVGYQVMKKVSLGVGADLQQLLGNSDNDRTLVFQSNDETKLLPGTDVGITGKTEYAVSKSLKAGILYREGINNIIHGGNEYFDRRYVQVQLKFTLLGR